MNLLSLAVVLSSIAPLLAAPSTLVWDDDFSDDDAYDDDPDINPPGQVNKSPNPLLDEHLFRLGIRLLQGTKETSVASPFSVALALEVYALGSDAETRKRISEAAFGSVDEAAVLDYLGKTVGFFDNTTTTVLNTAVFIDKSKEPLSEEFVTPLRDVLNTTVAIVDFAGADEATRLKINEFYGKELYAPGTIDSTTRFAFGSTLDTEGRWDSGSGNQFHAIFTKPKPFYGEDGVRDVKAMHGDVISFDHYMDESLDFVRIDLDDYNLNVFFILPRNNGTLSELKAHLLSPESGFRIGLVKSEMESLSIKFQVPLISLTNEKFHMLRLLESLGIPKNRLNLSRISQNPDGTTIAPGDCMQNIKFELNEDGVSASASLYFPTKQLSGYFPEDSFIIDRPFLFGIAHSTIPLFVGQFY